MQKKPFLKSAPHGLQNQLALITGASRGIGQATAELFAAQGARLILTSRSLDSLKKAKNSILKNHPNAEIHLLAGAIQNTKFVEKLFQFSHKQGGLDVLVNNAGTIEVLPIEKMTLKAWNQTFETNLTAVFHCSKRAFLQMKKKKTGGAIINLSSVGGLRGYAKFPGFSAYSSSKFGVIGLTECLAVEGRPYQIRANAICPGAVETQMLKKAAPQLKTHLKPKDIAQAILFFADPSQSENITGATLEIPSGS